MYKINKNIKKILRSRPALYREEKSQKFLLLDRQEKILNYDNKTLNNFIKNLKKKKLNLYPEIPSFYKSFSKLLGIAKDNFFFTEGVTGCIKLLIEAYTERKKSNIIISDPTFPLYEIFGRMYELKVKKIKYNKEYKLKIEDYINAIDKKTAMIFLPNPDSPIDFVFNEKDVKFICEYCKKRKIIVAIDEVYFPYFKKTYVQYIKNYNNIFIMRSFSKVYGLAGIRLGFLVSSKENINYISQFRGGYETNTLSLTAGLFFLRQKKQIRSYLKDVKIGRKYLVKILKNKGFKVISHFNGNFIFIKFKSPLIARKISQKLKENNVMVKSGFKGFLKNGILVTVAKKKLMNIFLQKLFKITNN